MKRIPVFLLMLSIILSITSCGNVSKVSFDPDAIHSYRDIPGVTPEEIAAIEALKSTHDTFSYGHLYNTEFFQSANGDYTGFTLEVCGLLSELFGIPFEQKTYQEWADLKSDIDMGVTDFSGEFTLTAERSQTYFMTTPIAGRGFSAYTLKSAPGITTEADLNGKRVGFMGGNEMARMVLQLYSDSDFTVVDVPGFSQAVDMLESGEIDAFITDNVSDTIFDAYDNIRSKRVFEFAYVPVSITTKNTELEPVISVIDKYLNAGGIDKMFRLYNENLHTYNKYKLNQSFTEEERAYLAKLKENGTAVNAALMHDAYPASFYNKKEKRYDGAAYDIINQVSDLTGITFNSDCMPVEKSLAEILEKLKSGEISLMPQLLYSESRKNDYIWSDTSYITTHFALLSKSDYPDLQPFQVYYATVGTVDKSVHEEVFKEAFPDHEKTIAYKTGDEVFDALERGEIDLVMLSETMLLVQTNYREKLGYKINLTFNQTLDTLYGFNKDEVILRNIFDKSLDYIDVKGIEEDWLSRSYDYQRRMYQESIPYIILTVVVLLAALIIVIVFYLKNRQLSRNLEATVNERTRELGEKTTTLSTIYNSIPDLVFCKDANSKYTSCNPSFEKFAGMTEAELIGKDDIEIFKIDREMASLFIEADKKVLNSKEAETIEELITYPDGEQKLMETIKTSLIRNNEVIGMIGISRDITQRKEMEDRLVEAKEQAEQNSKAKSDFLSRMSHEMRTPMNAIIGMTGIGKTADEIERKNYCLDKIESASTHLLGVINDVLDISKIEAGKFELSYTDFNLQKMLTRITNVLLFRMEEKGQRFTINIDNNVPQTIISDEQHLGQVITNLIGNSIKFTPDHGTISLLVRSAGNKNGFSTLQFEVKDTGIGISEEQQKKLFTSFEQGDGSVSRKYGGTGLGLSISKHIVEMMDGQIWVESIPGEGSSFIFNIRAQDGSGRTAQPPADTEDPGLSGTAAGDTADTGSASDDTVILDGKRILLAEDVEINREIVITLLEPSGIQIDSAENGAAAYQMFQANPDYDLILMDIHMPEVDGYTATNMIRSLNDPRAKSVPIIAMTANVFREDIEQCLEAGMNAHIGKPIDFADMMGKITHYLSNDRNI